QIVLLVDKAHHVCFCFDGAVSSLLANVTVAVWSATQDAGLARAIAVAADATAPGADRVRIPQHAPTPFSICCRRTESLREGLLVIRIAARCDDETIPLGRVSIRRERWPIADGV